MHTHTGSAFDNRDETKFALEFDNVRSSNVFSRFEIRRIISRTHRRIWIWSVHNRQCMFTLEQQMYVA